MRKIIAPIILLSVTCNVYSQPNFTQEIFNKMLINPAFTAKDSDVNKELSLQWKNKTNLPTINYLLGSYQMQFPKLKSSIGIIGNYNNYNQGPILYRSNLTYYESAGKICYRYNPVGGLSMGIDAGLVSYQMTYTNDAGGVFTLPEISKRDIDAGVSYVYKTAYVGFSLAHLTHPQYLYIVYPFNIPSYNGLNYNITAGYSMVNDEFTIDGMVWCNYSTLGTLTNIALVGYIKKHLFVGLSAYFGFFPLDFYDLPYCVFQQQNAYSIILGARLWNNKLRLSFSLDSYIGFSNYNLPSMQNTESFVGYKF
jgi:hypothetical protein